MPYIAKSQKEKVEKGLAPIQFAEMPDAGCLNFAVHQLISQYILQNKEGYQTYNDIVGVLDCAKMEIYRRLVSDYEDRKIVQNGDVLPYTK